jgi:hypothetical protein
MSKFIDKFSKEYFNLLNPRMNWERNGLNQNLCQRGRGFNIMFDKLLEKNKLEYNILETGVLRTIGNWKDGQSSFLFQEFCRYHGGTLQSIDIDEETCNLARSFLDSNIVSVTCDNSINFLKTVNHSIIDLFYLDSYDVVWNKHYPSANHHLTEFLTIEDKLAPGTIVAIDDNTYYQENRVGKGTLIYEYLKSKDILPIYDDYQLIYQF